MSTSTLQINQNTYNIYKYTAFASLAVIFLLGATFLQPFSFTDNSYAEEVEKSSSAEMSVTVEPVIEIWTTDTNDEAISAANIELDPDESIATTTVRTHVSTSNTTGYTLTIQSESTDAKMVHEDNTITKTINPIAGEGTSTTSWRNNKDLNNMWGYSIGSNDSYLGVPGSSSDTSTINETSGPSNDSSTDVTFAAKADTSLPAGTYKDTVIFSAIANEIPDPVEYMHELDASWCNEKTAITSDNSSSIENYTYKVADARTNEKYWVRKFGNLCWMVENLYLPTGATISTANNYSKVDFPTYPTTENTGKWDNVANGAMIANGSRYRTTNSGNYDGTYMNWYTATTGTGGDYGTDKAATSDICPTNWRLPTSSEQETIKTTINGLGINNFYATSTGATTTSPIMPGGYFSRGLDHTGTYVYWWSSTQYNTRNAYYLYENGSSLNTSGNIKSYGVSVRCVLPAE